MSSAYSLDMLLQDKALRVFLCILLQEIHLRHKADKYNNIKRAPPAVVLDRISITISLIGNSVINSSQTQKYNVKPSQLRIEDSNLAKPQSQIRTRSPISNQDPVPDYDNLERYN